MLTMLEDGLATDEQNILDLDASTLAMMIANKEITSYKVTEVYINHIKKKNPAMNFLVEDRFKRPLRKRKKRIKN